MRIRIEPHWLRTEIAVPSKEVERVQWDLGLQGLATMLGMAIVFGLFAQALFWSRATWWVGLVAGAAYFLAGLFISEVMFGWATEEQLQPNIDGLSFDEVLLGGLVGGLLVLAARYLARERLGPPIAH